MFQIVVNEDWVARAVTMITEHERYIVEGAGSVGVAAILAGLLPNLKGKKCVVFKCSLPSQVAIL